MAKGSLFWGNGRGKLGEAVFYRSGGEQRTRMYVAKIKNPKSLAQVVNRLSMQNFATFYRLLKPILSQSFTLRKSNQSGFNAFVSKNKNANSPVNSKEALQNGYVAMDGFILSDGTLLNQYQYYRDLQATGFVLGKEGTNPTIESIIEDPIGGSESQALTKEQISTIFTALGLSQKAVITVVQAGYADEGYRLSYNTFDVNHGSDDMTGAIIELVRVQPAEDGAEPFYVLGCWLDETEDETLKAVIISDRDADGKLVATNSSFILSPTASEYITQFKPNGYVWQQVLNQMGYNPNSALVNDTVAAE